MKVRKRAFSGTIRFLDGLVGVRFKTLFLTVCLYHRMRDQFSTAGMTSLCGNAAKFGGAHFPDFVIRDMNPRQVRISAGRFPKPFKHGNNLSSAPGIIELATLRSIAIQADQN